MHVFQAVLTLGLTTHHNGGVRLVSHWSNYVSDLPGPVCGIVRWELDIHTQAHRMKSRHYRHIFEQKGSNELVSGPHKTNHEPTFSLS